MRIRKSQSSLQAAGKGTRVGGPVPKQYLKIGGEPVILKTLKAFAALDEVDHIFIVTNEEYMDRCRKSCEITVWIR